jgi:GcrA cell cycle regulator
MHELWVKFSASQVATMLNAEFGTSYTRNAIIGRACRDDIRKTRQPSAPKAIAAPKPTKPAPLPKVRIPEQHKPLTAEDIARLPRVIIAKDAWVALPGSNPVGLMALTRKTCRWPIDGLGEQHFCGQHVVETGVYCIVHAERNFRPHTSNKRFESAAMFASRR